LLGAELRKLLPNAHFPTHEELDVTNPTLIRQYLDGNPIELIIHGAAFMPPRRSDKEPARGIQTNIIGTANIAVECIKRGIKLVYISTDYVFKGDKGNYKEEDEVYPINNYAWSKLGGEAAARLHNDAIIIRTSFGARDFPHERAFIDHWTSKQPVGTTAEQIVDLISKDVTGVYHIGGKRKTLYEYAKTLPNSENVGRITREEVKKSLGYGVPKDTSLNTDKFNTLQEKV